MNARKQVLLVCLIVVSYFMSFMLVSAMDLQLAPLDASGYLQPSSSFNYSFIFSDSNTCAPVIYRENKIVSTNQHGYAYISLTTGNFTQTTTYLCEYRNSTLRAVHTIPSMVFQNVTAAYYVGDGSLLTGLAGGGDILSVNTNGPYLSGGALSGAVDLLVNETYLNSTITSIASNYGNSSFNQSLTDTLYAVAGAGNSSWNETYATTLYADISVTGGNSSFNETHTNTLYYLLTNPFGFYNSTDFSIDDYYLISNPFSFYNSTNPPPGANSSWNETLADTLYADISVTGGNLSFNETYTNTLYYGISNPSSFWNNTYATFNKTYADTLYASISVTGDNSSWNQTHADTLYADISVTGGNASWNETYANTLYADISVVTDNSSWNENHANTLYYSILNPFGFYNSTDFSIVDYFTKVQITAFNYFNSTNFPYTYLSNFTNDLGISNYSHLTNFTDNLGDRGYTNNLNFTNGANFWNDTYATFNKTYADMLYADILVTGDNSSWNETYANTLYAIVGYGDNWNKTYADTLYADIGVTGDNSSFNQSLTSTLYYNISNPSAFWNSTFALFNKTYADTLYASIAVTGDNSSWNETHANTLYRLDSWNNITGIPHATPIDGDTTHFSLSDEIYDFVVALIGTYTHLSNFTDDLGDRGYTHLTNFTDDLGYLNNTHLSNLTNDLGFSNYSHLSNFTDDLGNRGYTSNLNFTNDASYWNDTYATFNKTYADTLYADINSVDTNCSEIGSCNNVVYNLSSFDTDYLSEGLTNLYDNSTWNETLADTLYADILVTGDNSSWNESYANTLYADISIVDTDTNETSFVNNLTTTDCTAGNLVIGIQDNGTVLCAVDAGNSSFNETYTNTLYRLDSWDNITGIPHATPSDGDTTHFSLADEIYDWVIGLAYTSISDIVLSIGNWSADKGDYSTTAEANNLYAPINYGDDWNKTYADTLYADISVTGDNSSWNETYADTKYPSLATILGFGYYNSTDFSIANYYTSSQIDGFSYYNSTYFSISDYYSSSDIDSFSYYNATNPQTETDSLAYNGTLAYNSSLSNYVLKSGDTMSGNLNMSINNFTAVDCIIFNSGGKICSS